MQKLMWRSIRFDHLNLCDCDEKCAFKFDFLKNVFWKMCFGMLICVLVEPLCSFIGSVSVHNILHVQNLNISHHIISHCTCTLLQLLTIIITWHFNALTRMSTFWQIPMSSRPAKSSQPSNQMPPSKDRIVLKMSYRTIHGKMMAHRFPSEKIVV